MADPWQVDTVGSFLYDWHVGFFVLLYVCIRSTGLPCLCTLAAGGRGGRNARFLVGDQDDSDEGEEEEEEGRNSKKGYFSDPESEESEDKSK